MTQTHFQFPVHILLDHPVY